MKAIALLFACLVLAACASVPAPSPSVFDGASRPDPVLEAGLRFVEQRALTRIPASELTLAGLSGLSIWRPGLTATRLEADGLLALVDGGRVLAATPWPDEDQPTPWAGALTDLLGQLRRAAPMIAAARDEDVYTALFSAMTSGLDEYSRYHSARAAAIERSRRDGYGGVGLSLTREDRRYRVSRVVHDGPAAAAGIKVGDEISEIDGALIDRLAPTRVHRLLTGPPGSPITLEILRGEAQPRRITLARAFVVGETVAAARQGGLLEITIDRFNAGTFDAVADVLGAAARDPPRGILFDLRGNPGGLLDQAVNVADLLLPAGTRLLTTAGRHPGSLQRHDATDRLMLVGVPVVVLIDGKSASAAELFAGALKDSGRAVIIGARSLGKGSVQTVGRLPNGGELLITWSRLFTPAGRMIHGNGIQPALCLPVPEIPDQPCPPTELGGMAEALDRARALLADPADYRALLSPPTGPGNGRSAKLDSPPRQRLERSVN